MIVVAWRIGKPFSMAEVEHKMLTVFSGRGSRDCEGATRRDFLRVGALSLGSLTLPNLLAARAGAAASGEDFVNLHSAGWDMHADGNNPGMVKGMEMLGRSLDKAVSAFLEDVDQRGLSDKIVLVITGDFGRTPRVNKKGGRDHWAKLGTLAFAGGGLRMGQAIGQSARKADVPAANPVSTPE